MSENLDEKNLDFERSKVPNEYRRSFANITIVWLGFVFVITSMMTGGGLASGVKPSYRNIDLDIPREIRNILTSIFKKIPKRYIKHRNNIHVCQRHDNKRYIKSQDNLPDFI